MAHSQRERLVQADKRLLWHPYTPMQRYIEETDPLVIERAQGSMLYDLDGRSYIDGNASWWTSLLGHNHPRLVRALRQQAERLCHVALAGITHQPAVDCARALVEAAPHPLMRVFFSDNGSTAVECALRLALQYHAQNGAVERRRVLTLEGAFHGDTLGAAALSGVAELNQHVRDVGLDVLRLPSPAHNLDEALDALLHAFEQDAGRTAALVVEPMVQGAAGMHIYDREYLRVARRLCSEHGVLLIADEVFTGFGRTGTMWAVEHADIAPDIMCVAKGLGGGMLPFAATLASERVFEGFLGGPERAFYYGHTYCGNPLGAAIASEVMAIFREERVLEQVANAAKLLQQASQELAQLPQVKATRTLGMILAVDLEGAEGYLERGGWRIYQEALLRGAYIRPLGNVVYLTPALNIPLAELTQLLDILYKAIVATTGGD